MSGAIVPARPIALWGFSDRSATLLTTEADPDGGNLRRKPGHDCPLSTVVTFYPHPHEFFSGQMRPWLTPLDEKAALLERLGVQQLVLLPFTSELAQLSAEDFVQEILVKRLQAKHISIGADFRFGHRRQGDATLLCEIATRHGITMTVTELAQDEGDRISSSRIRQSLLSGDLEAATRLLGRPYCLYGRVVQGQQLGRQLGFPTANLQVPQDKFLPRTGVYSVRVYCESSSLGDRALPGVMNLGTRPTVSGTAQTLEVHLLDWHGDLYGQTLTVALESFLRPEQRFESLDHLKHQIQADCDAAYARLGVGDRRGVGA